MKTRIAVVLASFLAVAVLNAQARPARGSAPAPSRPVAPVTSHGRPTPPIAAAARGSYPGNSITRPFIPPGWGLAQGPVSTVNNPGGLPSAQRFRHGSGIAVYYPVAVYPFGYYSGYFGPQQVVDNPDNQAPAPYTNGNAQQDAQPQMISYNNYPAQYPVAPNPAAEVTYSLLAFKDHSIYAVVDYWLENNRVNYVTNYGAAGSVTLDKIDIDLTVQLNGERNTKFELHEKQPGN